MMVQKNESESSQLFCLYSKVPNWLIHFQKLESLLGTKFLQNGCCILQAINAGNVPWQVVVEQASKANLNCVARQSNKRTLARQPIL